MERAQVLDIQIVNTALIENLREELAMETPPCHF
jgi:hypothetical protein